MARTDDPDAPETQSVAVQSYRTSPDRTVFSEDGNPEGWIATDLAVTLRR